jgi:hypothetical protein
MDTRILLDYIQRRPWLWGLVTIFMIFVGFQSNAVATSLLFPAIFYVSVITMSTELQNQGPVWVQRMLPVRKLVLVRTIWGLMVITPVLVIAVSLLPAYCYGIITGNINFASVNLFRIITTGLLFTGAYSIFIILWDFWWKYKLLRIFFFAGALVMGAGAVKVMNSGQYWDEIPIRVSMIAGAVLLLIVSYIVSPHILRVTGRKQGNQHEGISGQPRLKPKRSSMINMMLESPTGRALASGLWLLIIVMCINLFMTMRYGHAEAFDNLTNMPAMVATFVILSILLFSISAVHITSFRAMACLPMSRVRQTLTYFGLPVIAVAPLALFMIITMMFTTTEPASGSRSALMLLYCLMTVHVGLALQVRFGKIAAIVGLVVITHLLMMRVFVQGKHIFSDPSGLEILVMLGIMLATGLWTHRTLGRYQNAYRHQLVSAELSNH